MNKLNLCNPIILESNNNSINHITFNGFNYFCTVKDEDKIIKLNSHFIFQKDYYTSREYNCICYDWHDECFWATSEFYCDKIFKLDCDMNEIDCIQIKKVKVNDAITGISFNCDTNTLIISFRSSIISINKKNEDSTVLYSNRNGIITNVLSIPPGMIVTILEGGKYHILIFNLKRKTYVCYCIDAKFRIKNLIFNPCKSQSLEIPIEIFILEKCDELCVYNWNIPMKKIGFKPYHCNYKICNKKKCCEIQRNSDPCSDVIESIALIETSISHILNSEGEKIQKVLAETNDINTILSVNSEVNKTIINVTHLEQILYEKLNRIIDSDLCCDKKDPCKLNCHTSK